VIYAVSRESARRYSWGDGCDAWLLASEGLLDVREERMPPGTAEKAHAHSSATQFFYILEGAAVMRGREDDVLLAPGVGVVVPPGSAHQMTNTGKAECRFLVMSAPSTQGDRTDEDLPGREGGGGGGTGSSGPSARGPATP
jgi:mannose-6-phosphate isomerase-like protein (cupin superfamily)